MDLLEKIIDFVNSGIPDSLLNFRPIIESKFTENLGVDSLKSQQFSVGIFYFLVVGIIFFAIIAFAFMFKDKTKHIKKGEMVLFIWIILGLVVAVIFGASQLMHGYLF